MNTQEYVSDELTHFVGRTEPTDDRRYSLLRKILNEGWLRPSSAKALDSSFTMHSDGGKRVSTNEAITCKMLCFCDIPLRQLQIHMKKYKSFAIAFSKQRLLRHGASPVHYVARNALNHSVGVGGPRTMGERLDELRSELQRVQWELQQYVGRVDGVPAVLTKLSPPQAPAGHQLLGRFSALQNEIEYLLLSRLKFFTEGLPEDDAENFYMEREWRLHDGHAFQLGDIARIIVPREYEQRFRDDVPSYSGNLTLVPL